MKASVQGYSSDISAGITGLRQHWSGKGRYVIVVCVADHCFLYFVVKVVFWDFTMMAYAQKRRQLPATLPISWFKGRVLGQAMCSLHFITGTAQNVVVAVPGIADYCSSVPFNVVPAAKKCTELCLVMKRPQCSTVNQQMGGNSGSWGPPLISYWWPILSPRKPL